MVSILLLPYQLQNFQQIYNKIQTWQNFKDNNCYLYYCNELIISSKINIIVLSFNLSQSSQIPIKPGEGGETYPSSFIHNAFLYLSVHIDWCFTASILFSSDLHVKHESTSFCFLWNARPESSFTVRLKVLKKIIDFYNTKRPHMSNGMKTPAAMRQQAV